MGPDPAGIAGHFNFSTSLRSQPLFPRVQQLPAYSLGAESLLHAESGNPPHLLFPVHQVETMKGNEGRHMTFNLPYENLVVRIVMMA